MTSLVLVLPLEPGSREKARELLADGPPFDLEATRFDRHAVYLTDEEAVFVFESPDPSHTLDLPGEDPGIWSAARSWREIVAGQPRIAETGYAWARSVSKAT